MKSISLITKTIGLVAVLLLCSAPAFGQGMGRGDMGIIAGMTAPLSPLDQLKESLRTAKGDAAQKKVLTKIKNMLSAQYDSFLRSNEAELQEMERSVKGLRAQLERRKSAKTKLLALELQRIANEASGLAWPEVQQGRRGMAAGPGMSMGMGGMMGGRSGMGLGVGRRGDEDDLFTDLEIMDLPDPETETTGHIGQITLAALNLNPPTSISLATSTMKMESLC